MQLEPALISYAGLACWALSTQRLRRELIIPAMPAAAVMRGLAALVLLLAAARAVYHFGPHQGPVALIGMLSMSGLLLLLVLSRWPRLAISGAVVAATLAAASVLSSNS